MKLVKILPILWLIGFILPFILLPLKWALVAVFLVFIGGFPINLIVLTVAKIIFHNNGEIIGLIDGATEATAYLLISALLNPPANFLLVLIFLYIANQLNRIFRSGQFDKEEYYVLVGFIIGLLILFLFKNLILIR